MNADAPGNMLDMDDPVFDADAYVNKVLKECSLKDVMNVESTVIRDTQSLHSDMQTLVYENYNKFISATDTMRKMKTEFKQMETEMNLLVSNVKSITHFSDQITSKLHDSRQQLSALSEKQLLLQKLQFLSSLPTKLKALIDDGNYGQAVKHYGEAHAVLEQYGGQPSFQGIRDDCNLIMDDLKRRLKTNVQVSGFSAKAMIDTGDLLLQLGEKPADLSREILQLGTQRLHEQIVTLQDLTNGDMIEFVDMSIKGFINDLILMASSYTEMFLAASPNSDYSQQYDELNAFVTKNLEKFSALVQVRVEVETGHGDYNVLLSALDRLYRRLFGMQNLTCDIDMSALTIEIIVNAANQLCNFHLKNLKETFADSLSSIRLALVVGQKSQDGSNTAATADLLELVNRLYITTNEKVKVVVHDLLIFIKPEWAFDIKSHPMGVKCIEGIRENLVVGFLNHIAQTMIAYGDICLAFPPNLLLVFSKMCLEMEQHGVKKVIMLVDDLFAIDPIGNAALTHENDLYGNMRKSAQILLDSYVRLQGLNISQMLRKSVETRDWLNCLEPRSVRAVMKRIVDELSLIDTVLSDLYENGAQTAASSDSSRKTHFSISASKQPQYRSNWSNCTPANLEPMLATNMHRLFSDKIDIFGSVQFTKISILTGIIKLSLKTFLECVRLRTFSKFGLQQIQVDTHYLQMNLWRFVADENIMHYLLDEILGSAVHRCFEPNLMEPTAVGIICDQIQ